MKIRIGFVSNSSSTSFCIYGWTEDVFKDKPELRVQKDDKIYYCHGGDALKKFLKTTPHELNIVTSCSPSNDFVMGVGTVENDIDHYMEDWEDHVAEEPTQKEMEELDKVAEKLNLPKPQMYSATWRNG
jgi:hypothetical protein